MRAEVPLQFLKDGLSMRSNPLGNPHRPPGRPLLLLLIGLFLLSPARAATPRLRALIVGGGPDPQHNQVAIERNVYYVSHLLPSGAPRWILFTSGDPAAVNV